jgi:hypothetical protein
MQAPLRPIGLFRTEGSLVTLPYCWYSAIDTWDNPSLCAVDTYDISGDAVRFRSRTYNRPDLLPIAKAIEYARERDYPAVLAYCTSGDVARRLVRDIPPRFFAGVLQVTRTANGKEHIEMESYRFDVEKRADRWLVGRRFQRGMTPGGGAASQKVGVLRAIEERGPASFIEQRRCAPGRYNPLWSCEF